jgi:hypothetical protein
MTERDGQGRDPHPPLDAWLSGGAQAGLPRDIAVHASVCAECQVRIAAFDMLAAVELDRADFPPQRVAVPIRPARQGVAMAAGGVVALSTVAAVAAGGWRLLPIGASAGGSEAPTQEVLGNTGQPTASHRSTGSASPSAAEADPSASASAGTSVLVPSIVPVSALPSPTLKPGRTPSPTQRSSAGQPTPTLAPSPTSTPTPPATPEPPTPTPDPTLEPTPAAP